MGSEKGIDAAQVKMETADGSSRSSGACSTGSKKMCILSFLGFVFVLLNLAALWALHFADRPVTKTSVNKSLGAATRYTTSLFTATDDTTPAVGDAVSFNPDGKLRNGAGTTGYLNRLTLGSDLQGVSFINFAPMGKSGEYFTTNVMSYTRKTSAGATENVVTTLKYNMANKTLTQGDVDTTNNVLASPVRGLATLSDTKMAVLVISSSYDVAVAPATLDSSAGTVKVDKTKTQTVQTSSSTAFIGALSSSSFVVAYYDTNSASGYWQRVKAGTINSDGSITVSSTGAAFAAQNDANTVYNFGSPLALSGVGANGFVVPYYDSINSWSGTSTTKDVDLKGLCVTSATVTGTVISTFNTPVCNSAFRPNYYPESVALSDKAMAIVFHDKANNNALTIAVVTTATDGTLHFRSTYVFSEVGGDFDWYNAKYGGYSPIPRLRLLPDNRLVVSFLNPTLAGRLSVRVLQYSPSTMVFRELTPVLPTAPPTFTLAVASASNTYGPITHDTIPVGDDSFVTAYVGNRDNTVHQNFAVVETFGSPVGVMQSTSSGSTTIAMQGTVDVSGLTVGKMHYAMTSGAIVTPDSTSTDSNSADFFYTGSDSVLITTDSRVGMAVDKDTLFVSTAF